MQITFLRCEKKVLMIKLAVPDLNPCNFAFIVYSLDVSALRDEDVEES